MIGSNAAHSGFRCGTFKDAARWLLRGRDMTRARSTFSMRAGRPIAAIATILLLAGCGDTSVGSGLFKFGAQEPPKTEDLAAKYAALPTCPAAQIRYGTETILRYDSPKSGPAPKSKDPTAPIEPPKPNDPDLLRVQINVQRVARECQQIGDTIVARVGAAGRVLGGPRGTAGKIDVPVRIAAVKGDEVIYTAVKVVQVSVEAPDFSADWSLVDEAVSVPAVGSSDTIIYVGLDDKAKVSQPGKPIKKK
eukprot:gene24924-26892_t